jgi:Big-like domain-containing protein
MRRRHAATPLLSWFLLLVALIAPAPATAVLERVGPIQPANGYPAWYQDTSGLMLEYCSPTLNTAAGPVSDAAEYNGGWCLLLPTPPPGNIPGGLPEVYPTNFSVEHFYWSGGSTTTGTFAANGAKWKAKLVLSVEGSFAALAVVPGQQITFARIRIFMPAAPIAGTYVIYHPYGVMTVPGIAAGNRVFFTQDVGLGCAQGAFDCLLPTPIGPFLIPSATPGGAELPPVGAAPAPALDPLTGCGVVAGATVCDPFWPVGATTTALTGFPATGKMYLSDPARKGPVTGSSLAPFVSPADGVTRSHNIFRIEVIPAGGGAAINLTPTPATDEFNGFSVMGRIFSQTVPGHVTLDRASYARPTATGGNKLDVFVTALPTVQARVPPGTALPPVQPTLQYYDAPCSVDAVTGALGVPVDPLTLLPLPPNAMTSAVGWKYVVGQSQPPVIPTAVCVEQTNAINSAGQQAPLFAQAPVTDQIFITEALFNPNTNTFSVKATSSDQLAFPTLTVGGYGDVCSAAPGAVCAVAGEVPGQLLVASATPWAPPNKVTVISTAGGMNARQVKSAYFTGAGNTAVVANNDAFTVNEDCSALPSTTLCPTPPVFPILANDTVGGAPIPAGAVVTLTTAPLLGKAVVNLDGTVTYTPNLNANGIDGFNYTVTVNGFLSNVGAVTITVNPVNDTPVAVADTFAVAVPAVAGTLIPLNVFANDTDPDGATDLANAVAITPVSAPAGAVWSVAGGVGGIVNFTTNLGGTYTFTYQAQDKGGGTATILTSTPVLVTVNAAAGEVVTVLKAQYTVSQARWTVSGTYAPATAATAIITIKLANGPAAGTVIGTALNTAGTWLLDIKPVTGALIPTTTTTQVVAIGPGGATSLPFTFTRK